MAISCAIPMRFSREWGWDRGESKEAKVKENQVHVNPA
jgi:hypothetical protein